MPTQVSIEFDSDLRTILLRGDGQVMSRHPLFGIYLRSIGAVCTGAGMTITADEDSLHTRYQELSDLVRRCGFELIEAEGDETLAHVKQDEEDFATFSRAAEDIWNGDVDVGRFAEFARLLSDACPGRTFYPRQLLSAFHLAFSQNACNFSVPGAGKTSIVYAAYAALASLPVDDPRRVDHLLIIGPLSSFKAWQDEFRDIFLRDARAKRIAGFVPPGDRSAYLRGVSFGERDVELTLTTYASLAANVDAFQAFVASPARQCMVVLDEAHYIKRPDGYWSNAALNIAPHAVARVVLTGTPAPNGYEDLSNLFRFIYPKRNVVGFSNPALKAMSAGFNPGGVERLKRNVRPFYTRIRKRDLGLPEVIDEKVDIALSPVHQRIYDAIERAVAPQLRVAGQGSTSSLVRARLMRLRQAAVNPALLLRPLEEEGLLDVDAAAAFSVAEVEVAEMVRAFDPAVELRRLAGTVELARQAIAEQGKLVIWSYFIGNLTLLKGALADVASFVEIVTGATPVAEEGDEVEDIGDLATREALINRFHRVGETAILIANPQAVGESISLHKACRTAIYFDRDFNAGKLIQSKDRIHRYSATQLGPVSYKMLMASNTLEASIDRRLAAKEQRLSDLVDSDEIPLFSLGEEDRERGEDIRAILEDYERRKAI